MPAEDTGKKEPHRNKAYWPRRNRIKNGVSGISAFIHAYRAEQKTNREEERREDTGNKWLQGVTLAFVIGTTIGIFVQAWLFSGQLDEMKSSGEQATLLIENNAKLAIAAGKQADAAEKQAVAMGDYAKATRDSVMAAQRAWVGPRNIKASKAPVLNESLEAILEYQNTGRDPATETIKDMEIFTGTDAEDQSGLIPNRVNNFLSSCKIMWKPLSANVVYPSTGLGTPYNLTKLIDGEMIDEEVVAGTKNIYAVGCFVYKTFETVHRSWFCYYFKNGKVKPETWAICEAGNGAD